MKYKLTVYFAGKDASIFVEGDIKEIVPIGKYTRYDIEEVR